MNGPVPLAGAVGIGGAFVQIGYGVIAVLWPYPTITDALYEVMWGLVNLGMVATVVGLAVVVRPRSGRMVLIGAILAVAGHLARVVVSVLLATGTAEGAGVDGAIAASILAMLGGMAILGVATVRARPLPGWRSWLPLATVATGLITAAFYSIDPVAHFVMLGLLWGVPWLLLAIAVRQSGSQSPPGVRSAGSVTIREDGGTPGKVAGGLSLLLGLGFGIPGVIGTIRFAEDSSVWKLMGLPTYGNGPFVDVGIPTTVPLLVGFVIVCAAEVLVGVVLLFRPRVGGWLSIALLPFELAYWIGFALPFGPILGALRTLAVIPTLRRTAKERKVVPV